MQAMEINQRDVSRYDAHPHNPERKSMDFLKILNAFGAVMAWIIILVILWAIGPLLLKILTVIGHFQ